jgi:TRAP-type C4-dicarboxylate transport system substrate-binding protein
MGAELLAMVRKDNERAKKAMQKAGVKFIETPAALVAELQSEGQKVWKTLVGSLYQQPMLDKVLKIRGEAVKKFP